MSRAMTPPLAERIAAYVVGQINAGVLKSGDRIMEQMLADTFKTSRGPVRDAFKILQARNWIELVPQQGARVAKHESAPSYETILIGGVMLGLAFRFAVQKASDSQIDEFYRRARRVVRLGNDPESSAASFSAAAIETGNFAIALANNPRIADIVGPVPQGALSNYTPLSVSSPGSKLDAAGIWVELAAAFKVRDAARAERLGREMVESAHLRILRDQLVGGDGVSHGEG